MQCASPPCEQFHDEQRSHPLLQQIFREAMYQWFAAEVSSITAVSPVLFPTDEHRLLRQKNEIGWRQIFKGRFSTNERQWIQNEYHYYQHWKKTKYKRTGIWWQTNDKLHPCHLGIVDLGIVVWGLGVEKCSGGSLHGNTAETHAQAATRQDTER